MDEANGMLKGPKAMNGHAGVASSRSKPSASTARGPGAIARSFSIAARLFTWYSIITLLLRCPPTLDECTESSPRICRPYFQVKGTVAPYLTPYYDAYASPYVELARPYYGTVERTVLVPAREYISVYGAPRLAQAQAYGQAQWKQTVQPHVAKLKATSKEQYDTYLAGRVENAAIFLEPYLDIARTNALQTYHEFLLPTYETVQPYTLQGYNTVSAFTTETALPTTAWAWNKTYMFLDGTVWPLLRVMYVENVEPQLVRIGQRLGRHQDTKAKPSLPEATSAPTIR